MLCQVITKSLCTRQIRKKISFITGDRTYCYWAMPFGLKNAGTTYQWLMFDILCKQDTEGDRDQISQHWKSSIGNPFSCSKIQSIPREPSGDRGYRPTTQENLTQAGNVSSDARLVGGNGTLLFKYRPRTLMKAQVMAYFIAEFSFSEGKSRENLS